MMIQFGETIHSFLPTDIPWFLPDHLIFFGVLYAVVFVIAGGLGIVFAKSFLDAKKEELHD